MRRAAILAASAALVVVGLLAERQRYGWSELRDWLPDLVVGWALAGLGLAALALRRSTGAGVLLTASGALWFVGNFYALEPAWLGAVATDLAWLFLAPLVHLSLAYPTGRPRSALQWGGVVLAWSLAALPWLTWSDGRAAPAALGLLAVVGAVSWARASGRARRDAGRGVVALLGLVLWSLVHPRLGTVGAWSIGAVAFDAGVVLTGVWLYAGLGHATALAERAISLDEETGTVGGALRVLLADPQLRVGLVAPDGSFVDEAGVPVTPVGGLATFSVTDAVGGGALALVVHDPSMLATDDDRRAVSVAVTLAAERERLRREVRDRADDVAASTQRLIRAEDDARTALAGRIDTGPGARLARVQRLIDRLPAPETPEPELTDAITHAGASVQRARDDLEAFARGLGVPGLEHGIEAAVRDLVAGLPLSVDVVVDEVPVAEELAATAWFVCAEGVANALKHADARELRIAVARVGDVLEVVVSDDGCGGADVLGSGLVGLRDRLVALGGTLVVSSPPRGGTRLVGRLPLERLAT